MSIEYGVHKLAWGTLFDPKRLDLFFAQAKDAGAEVVEMRPTDEMFSLNKEGMAQVKKLSEEYQLGLYFPCVPPLGIDMRRSEEFVRDAAVEFTKRVLESVAAVGGRALGGGGIYAEWPTRFEHDRIPPEEKKIRTERVIECFRKIMPTAQDLGVAVNLEVINRFENYVMNTVEEGVAIVKAIDHPQCNLLLDVFHMNIEEDDIPAAIRTGGKYVKHFHATEPNRGIPFHESRIPWKEVGKALHDIHYDGAVIMETVLGYDGYQSHDMRMWRNLIPDLTIEGRMKAVREGLTYLRTQFSQ